MKNNRSLKIFTLYFELISLLFVFKFDRKIAVKLFNKLTYIKNNYLSPKDVLQTI